MWKLSQDLSVSVDTYTVARTEAYGFGCKN